MIKKSAKYGLSFLCFIVSTQVAFPQVTQPYRYEKEYKYADNDYTIISMEENGLALVQESRDYVKGDKVWKLTLLDSTLKVTAEKSFPVDSRNDFIGFDYQENQLSFLFRNRQYDKSPLTLVVSGLDSGSYQSYEIKPEINLRLTHFSQIKNCFALGGYVSNDPAILLYNITDQSLLIVPGFFQKDMELVDVRTNKDNESFNTVLIDRSVRDDRKLIVRTFDTKGTLLVEDVIDVDENKVLMNGIVTRLEREDLVVMGTWGSKNSKQSAGIYAVPVNPYVEHQIQYIDFGQFEHFYDYMKPKRAARIRAKVQEDVQAGRHPGYTNHVSPFRILEHPKGFILLADVYNPSSSFTGNYYPYGSSPSYYDPFWGGFGYPGRISNYPYRYNNRTNQPNNDAIKTYETFVTAIDNNAKLKWDYSFPLDDIKMPVLDQTADFALVNDNLYFIYKKKDELKAKIIPFNGNAPEELTEKIKLRSQLDQLRSENEREGSVHFWFENSFYVWGIQNIHNDTEEKRNRMVFYINRVVAQ